MFWLVWSPCGGVLGEAIILKGGWGGGKRGPAGGEKARDKKQRTESSIETAGRRGEPIAHRFQRRRHESARVAFLDAKAADLGGQFADSIRRDAEAGWVPGPGQFDLDHAIACLILILRSGKDGFCFSCTCSKGKESQPAIPDRCTSGK